MSELEKLKEFLKDILLVEVLKWNRKVLQSQRSKLFAHISIPSFLDCVTDVYRTSKTMEYSLLFYAVVLLPLAQSLTDTGLIEFINSNQSSWIAGMNFHNQTKEEILPLFHGVLGLHPDPNFTVPMVTHNIDQTTIPVNFDARNTWPYCANIIGNIRNQGTCGSCWAFSVAEVMSDRLCIQSGGKVNVQLAPEDILTCCHTCGNYCFGGYTGSAFQYVQMYGVIQYCIFGCKPYGASEYYYNTASPCQQTCSNTLYQTPYSSDKHFGTNYYQINPSELQIQAEIFAKGSVEADFTVYQDFWYYQSGVYYHTSGQYTGQHAIKIIGWGTENGSPYWLVANSWGKNWGSLGGFFKILRGRNECGIEQRVLAGNSRYYMSGELNDNSTNTNSTHSYTVGHPGCILGLLISLYFCIIASL
ncbi:cathepsin B-like cysteine proteinase 4 [Zophobas morio]|uniref:cathepsin B-like cysteine proteinase 4 n=1 Tax=Zophobas morio TaxID=2755281 RepID=UPI003082B111